ncbi:FmdB family zinc ribbon protein [Mesoterricola silvestris]|uniref:Putative regulatory protein FmdB zinc ribbon domain-containing protein n=1 Tax=Mesoterricola silvestris TaxID=2927979 RepID=A0AA48GMR6_9BACT|nr:zinc ribbon domain-containing protein [Mesoterricola silvestris]BDU72370.1 hypothetical protein METEAL_15440 [Mesoterricola silvestris]
MPLYEYECSTCHDKREHLEPVAAPESQPCQECGGTAYRQVSAGWFQMGDGDYK